MVFDYENEIQSYGLTKEQYDEILQLIVDKKNKVIDVDWSEIIERYNLDMTSDTLRKANGGGIFGGSFIYQYLLATRDNKTENNIVQPTKYSSETAINKDGSISSKRLIEMNDNDAKNPDFVLKAHGFEPDMWKIVSVRNTIRQAISQAEGVRTLYSSFLTVKPLATDEIPFNKWKEWFNELDRQYEKPVYISRIKPNGKHLLLIDMADIHLNMLATMFSTGNEYNCEIAKKLFFGVLYDIIGRVKIREYDFKKIIFCIGGDMLNGDGINGSTTKGTPQYSDTMYFDACKKLFEMIVKAIDLLKNEFSAIIEVIHIPGNHDEQTGFHLAMNINSWYRHDLDVVVDYSPLPRKYTVFGKTLFVFSHDGGNIKKLPNLIADEARQYWSEIDNTEVMLQHLHCETILMEENNMRIQRLPTISAKSKWINDKGYNSKRQCKSFVFDEDDGCIDVLYTVIK